MNPADYKPDDFQWSQRDPRWAHKKIGTSGLTVGGYGCAGTGGNYCVNRAWLALGINRFSRPGEFFDYCNTHGFFTKNGMLDWHAIDYFSGGKLKYTEKKADVFITMAQVRWGAYLHWIVLLNGNLCMNPWTGHFENRVQPIWIATGRQIYFKLIK